MSTQTTTFDVRFTATAIKELLRVRHQGTGWLVLDELRTNTGWGEDRRIDVFAMALWPSLEFKRVAYEIKVSRSDWLRELKQPDKRDAFFRLSHEAWFVLAPGVLRPTDEEREAWIAEGSIGPEGTLRYTKRPDHAWSHESLSGWGILEVQEDGDFKVIHRPQPREAWPMPESFIASLLRHAAKHTDAGLAS